MNLHTSLWIWQFYRRHSTAIGLPIHHFKVSRIGFSDLYRRCSTLYGSMSNTVKLMSNTNKNFWNLPAYFNEVMIFCYLSDSIQLNHCVFKLRLKNLLVRPFKSFFRLTYSWVLIIRTIPRVIIFIDWRFKSL